MTPWWQGRMLAYDTETSGPDPLTAHLVSFALVWVGGGEEVVKHSAIVNPGIEIPQEAIDVHGITNERAQSEGVNEGDALTFIVDNLIGATARGLPVVAFSAPFDLTLTDRRSRALDAFDPAALDDLWRRILVVDPRPLDQFLDKFRRSYPNAPRGMSGEDAQSAGHVSTRTLEGMCGVYGATLDGAHDAAFDALAAGRLAYRIGQRGEVLRNVRNAQDGRELAALKREWEAVRHDLPALVDFQRRHALAERPRFAEYKRAEAAKLMAVDPDRAAEALAVAGRVELERGWPVLEPLEVTP